MSPNAVNAAQYLSERIGQEEFLKICTRYGECLDKIDLSLEEFITPENVGEIIEETI